LYQYKTLLLHLGFWVLIYLKCGRF